MNHESNHDLQDRSANIKDLQTDLQTDVKTLSRSDFIFMERINYFCNETIFEETLIFVVLDICGFF